MPRAGFLFNINAAFNVNSSLLFIYSPVPSIGSISQKSFKFWSFLCAEFSSETIIILGVISEIFFVNILLTSMSPLLTGVLFDLISFVKPASLKLSAIRPAS